MMNNQNEARCRQVSTSYPVNSLTAVHSIRIYQKGHSMNKYHLRGLLPPDITVALGAQYWAQCQALALCEWTASYITDDIKMPLGAQYWVQCQTLAL